MPIHRPTHVIGRLLSVDFPEFDIQGVTAKVDTGAYTSSIHCHDIDVQGSAVTFQVLDPTHPEFNEKRFSARLLGLKDVRSSSGHVERRALIRTPIRIDERVLPAEFTLTDRSDLRHPVLIGRRLLRGRFLVDVSMAFDMREIEERDQQMDADPDTPAPEPPIRSSR